ncbi:PREDICTED: zinc finger protein 36, C3H1 type-like 2 [Dipodomys ordii]|uniref:mRNA decay activator protein ZFP36 n=1 Tax=Dipodomys ordii TaxID=10020 RepID=A0A1S3FBE9_DIPOR|nr:PREDICTED: zinc finger protein 36, C3H1 type-like 2 [Dipodomys ordii]
MSTTLLSAFYDIDFLCKTEKSLANLNLNNMLDKKAVGTPVAAAPSSSFTPGFLRRHSASNLHALAHPAPSPGSCSPKFPGAANGSSCGNSAASGPASYGPLKEPSGGGGTALLNKENKFRDRSFSENGERSQHLLHLQQQQQQQKGGGGSQINSTRYKTELCRPFEESGTCKYGEKCQFAHGFHELRSLTRHPKYKTELCRTFHTIGFCPYGPRCHFAPPSPPFSFQLPRRLSESPVFDAPPSPPDSLSDRDSYLSGSLSSGSLSGSESPSLDPGRRLPIFSRLSISDD